MCIANKALNVTCNTYCLSISKQKPKPNPTNQKKTSHTPKTSSTLNMHFLSFVQRHPPNLLIRDFPSHLVRIDNLLLLPIAIRLLNAAQTTKYSHRLNARVGTRN